jgi:hypothetical protein
MKNSRADLSADMVRKPPDMVASEVMEIVLTDQTHMVVMEATITPPLPTTVF